MPISPQIARKIADGQNARWTVADSSHAIRAAHANIITVLIDLHLPTAAVEFNCIVTVILFKYTARQDDTPAAMAGVVPNRVAQLALTSA